MKRFKTFDFEHGSFIKNQEPLQEFMRRAYLSKNELLRIHRRDAGAKNFDARKAALIRSFG
jgi:hypothetical protein